MTLVTSALALGFGIANFVCLLFLAPIYARSLSRRSGLRLDGNALHGRIVFVDHIDWEREIARWGLDSNGVIAFDWNSDYTLYTGYLIDGPADIRDDVRTAENAYSKGSA